MTIIAKSSSRLSASEKHDSLINLLNTINLNVNNLQDYCIKKFEEIHSKIEKLETNVLSVQSSNNSLNFTKVENKEEYLKNTIKNVIQCDIIDYLKSKSNDYITYQNIYDVLNEEYNLYTLIANIIENILVENNEKCIFCFPYQRSILYYWNHEKQTWEKMNNDILNGIFNTLQKEIINCYKNLINTLKEENTFHQNATKFMETSILLYLNDFEKKSKIFKKQLFDKIKIL